MIKEISKDQWDELANPFPLCSFPLTVFGVERILNVKFFKFLEDGLGKCFGVFSEIDDSQVFLQGFVAKDSKELGVQVKCRSTESKPYELIEQLQTIFQVPPTWISETLTPTRYGLFRIDDNDNEFEVYRFLDEASALAVTSRFEKKKHKQTYFIKVLS